MEDLLLWEQSVEELSLCFLGEDGAGELEWTWLHFDPGGNRRGAPAAPAWTEASGLGEAAEPRADV